MLKFLENVILTQNKVKTLCYRPKKNTRQLVHTTDYSGQRWASATSKVVARRLLLLA